MCMFAVSLCDYVHVRSKFVWLCACLYWWNLLLLHYWLLNLIIICFSLQELNVSFINVDEYPLELIPLDSDVLSLEMESSFKVHDWYLLSNLYWVDVAIKMQCFDNLMVSHNYLLKMTEENFFCKLFLSYNTSSSMLPINVLGERRLGIASRWRKV